MDDAQARGATAAEAYGDTGLMVEDALAGPAFGALLGTIQRLVATLDANNSDPVPAPMLEATATSEERYCGLFMHAPCGIYVATRQGRVIRANPALMRILGCQTVAEVCALNATAFYQRPDERDALIAACERSGSVTNHEAAWRTRDARPLVVCLTGRIIHDESTPDDLFEVFVDDVTETRRLEAALRQSQKLEAIGRLAAGVAHDFNNLLTAILGYTELLLDQIDAGKPIHADLREIQKAAQSAAALTHQLLAFSRKAPLDLAVVDMNDVVRTVQPLLRRVLSDTVRVVIQGGSGPLRLKADQAQLEQVLLNLAVNARDAMPDGGTLRIEMEAVRLPTHAGDSIGAAAAPGQYVRVSVTDTGTGMDEATRAQLFEPFFSTKGPGRGTGLGLAIVHDIVTQLGGHIAVTSVLREGSRFELYFPATTEMAGPRATPQRSAANVGRETILLVDDDPGILTLESAVLTRHGYRVIAAASPDAALALIEAEAHPVDLILSDVVMPGMSGPMLVQRLRETGCTRAIYMSGYERGSGPGDPLDDDAAFLRKPFKQNELLACVRRALDGAFPSAAELN